MYGIREAVQIRGFRPLLLFSSKSPWQIPRRDMEVKVSLATTGEQVYSTAYSEVNDLRVWELLLGEGNLIGRIWPSWRSQSASRILLFSQI